jgi:hypothetical protein
MKSILTIILSLILISVASASYAASLKFAWQYPTGETIAGFRLYRDGTIVDTDNIAPAARTVTVPRQTDRKSHTYHLTAYTADAESKPSGTVIDTYIAATVTPAGVLTIEVIQ